MRNLLRCLVGLSLFVSVACSSGGGDDTQPEPSSKKPKSVSISCEVEGVKTTKTETGSTGKYSTRDAPCRDVHNVETLEFRGVAQSDAAIADRCATLLEPHLNGLRLIASKKDRDLLEDTEDPVVGASIKQSTSAYVMTAIGSGTVTCGVSLGEDGVAGQQLKL